MSGELAECDGCGSDDLVPVLDMGAQPLAEGAQSGRYPLALVRCRDCSLVQLSYVVDRALVFQADHPYSTGNSGLLREHYRRLAIQQAGRLVTTDVVVDIGANDGTLLGCYPYGRVVKVAVEPTDQILKCPPDIIRYQEPFTAELASRIRQEHGPAKVITACNVLAHVTEPDGFLDGVQILLDDEDGVFVTENHDLASITEGLQVDTVYHEHLRYYTVASLSAALDRNNLRVTHVMEVPTHGGSFRTYARKKKDADFRKRALNAASRLREMLNDLTAQGNTVYGIGACTRATPLIHFAGIKDFITCVCEVPGSDKIGSRMPGTTIPVVDESALLSNQPEYALVFAWHMAGNILPKLRDRGYKGQFIVPLPEPRVVSAADAFRERAYRD